MPCDDTHLCAYLSMVHNITLALASRRERREFKVIFDNLIGWNAGDAGIELASIPASMCTNDGR